MGGLGLVNRATLSGFSYQAPHKLTKPLIEAIASQTTASFFDASETAQLWTHIQNNNRVYHAQELENVYPSLPSDLQHCVELAHERSSSSWLSAVPVESHDFYLNNLKGNFGMCFFEI